MTTKSEYRVLLTSDIHCTDLMTWYGVSDHDRLQHWVDTVLAEHKAQPFDLILIGGDVSLDYHDLKTPYDKGIFTTTIFREQFLSQLPKDIPVRLIPGNHEQFTHKDWLEVTGFERQNYALLGDNLFIMLDSYNTRLSRVYDELETYANTDVAYIKSLMEQYPTHKVWLYSHYFDMEKESDEFCALVAGNDRVKGLFMGHTHRSTVIPLGEAYKNKTIAQTGNFSYTCGDIHDEFWGLRDLIITENSAVSRYIQADSTIFPGGSEVKIERKITDIAEYN
ncbi:MAG: metallophosphoesterase [Clostridia bacterium]|nr:metallophosphoesterase [Clostridia bacterium]